MEPLQPTHNLCYLTLSFLILSKKKQSLINSKTLRTLRIKTLECQMYTCFYTSAEVPSLIVAVFLVFQVSEVALPCYVPHQGACGSAVKIFSITLNTIQIHYVKKKSER